VRLEEQLIDCLFNSSEKRLARVLLLLANYDKDGIARSAMAANSSCAAQRAHLCRSGILPT